MKFYRLKQFYWNLHSRLDEYDLKFINNILSEDELELFKKLSMSEQKHCVKVAYDVEKICYKKDINLNIILKAALLHDIGKIYRRLTIIDKSIMVLLNSITLGKMKYMCKFNKINVYYNHAKIGAKLLEKISCNKYIIFLVKNHDNNDINDNKYLNIIKYCDNNN
ncbi:putative nucleotidyltransferase with HDIG domain [Clostridium algifaecis]|uniref:Nucleotidyltransferase with HDIG domain n=1 Tax=Clostridium algifaecis TaxID=1472040 RepID=A0ABS4KVK0_9CLOT|nr:HD domain-containing protein [Clostridium algifaecis]MBP2034083.1 putative nucleotidyltransferase with HDIG domain [Clostridium algifaecis]